MVWFWGGIKKDLQLPVFQSAILFFFFFSEPNALSGKYQRHRARATFVDSLVAKSAQANYLFVNLRKKLVWRLHEY